MKSTIVLIAVAFVCACVFQPQTVPIDRANPQELQGLGAGLILALVLLAHYIPRRMNFH